MLPSHLADHSAQLYLVVELATAQRDLNGLAGRDVGRRRLQLLVD
jgi:hypothetical protein